MSRYSVAEVSIHFLRKAVFDLLRYFWRPTIRLPGTKRESSTNAVFPLDYLNLTHIDGQIASLET